MDRCSSDTFGRLLHDGLSLLILFDILVDQLTRAKTQCAIVAPAQHCEEHEGEQWLRAEIQDTVPYHLVGGERKSKDNYRGWQGSVD